MLMQRSVLIDEISIRLSLNNRWVVHVADFAVITIYMTAVRLADSK